IRTAGWVDLGGREFAQIAGEAVAIVHPSCSEGWAGCVVTSMHAGLIPIISWETGSNVDGFGVVLSHSTVAEIRAAALDLSRGPPDELRRRSRAAWEYARSHHTRERFAQEFRAVIERLVVSTTPAHRRAAA